MLPAVAAVSAAEHGYLGYDEYGARGGGADLDAVQVDGVVLGVEAVGYGVPAFAAVA